ncbi:MAG TPA: hypothetical protein VHV57_20815 [Acidimicrobiales bacterium]|nr:hypothetical protein [Acidimicrobiales bacterium]
MSIIETVLGPVDASDLGITLVHEHVVISYPGDHLDPGDKWDRKAVVSLAVERMHQLLEHGVRTFVDPCPIELGRDPELLAEVAETSGMQIVAATGFYTEQVGIPYYWKARTEEEIADLYLHEISNGIGRTGIRPGVIKVATGDPPSEMERRFVRAAGMAAVQSGLSIITHCENSVGGNIQQGILAAEGVDLSRVLVGHQDQARNVEILRDIASLGSFVGIDRVGWTLLASDDARADLVMALLESGYGDKICLSQDHACWLRSARWPYPVPERARIAFEKRRSDIEEQMHTRPHTFLFSQFWPRLRERGMDRESFERILTANPCKLFGGH